MKRWISILLVLCLLCAVTAGCGSTAGSTGVSESGSSAAAAEDSATAEPAGGDSEETPEPEPEAAASALEAGAEPEEPSGGPEEPAKATVPGEIAAAAINAGEIDRTMELPITDGGETLSYWCSTNFGAASGISSYNDHYGLKYAQERTGVNLTFVENNMITAREQFSLMVASNDLCDIIVGFEWYYTPGGDNAVDEDLILDLNEYLDNMPIYQRILETDPQWHESLETDGGRLCSIKALCTTFPWVKESVAVRGDWLDELGLELPKTFDDYFEVLSAFKSEYNPTYTLDIGTTLGNNWFEGGYGIGVASSRYSTTSDLYGEDGVVHDGLTSERFRDYLTMLHDWHDAGLISDDYVTIGNLEFFENQYSGLIAAGEFGCVNGAGGLLESYAAFSDDPDFRFVPSYAPRLTEDSTLCYLTESTLTNSDYAPSISTQCEYVELAMQYLDYFFTEEGAILGLYGLEGQSWEYDENGEPALTELITSAGDVNGALMAYKVNISSVFDPNASFRVMTSESAQKIMQFWTDDRNELMSHGNNAVYPSGATLSAEESEQAANLLADIATYVSESVPGFILGTKSLDEFDAYCEALEGMGIEDVTAIYQAAYDRYME